jgi:hypothetical protein
MRLGSKLRPFAFLLAALCLVPCLSAELDEIRVYHGKRYDCIRSGLGHTDHARDCGTQPYARVFTGRVKSAIEISDTNKLLILTPEENFRGDPVEEVTATVNQACMNPKLPEIQAGDHWLVYLQDLRDFGMGGKTTSLKLPFDSPSKPVSQAQNDIDMLRHLENLTAQSMIRGTMQRIGSTVDDLNPTPVMNRKVIAKGTFGEYSTLTDEHGHYEFDVFPDSYDVTADTDHGLREMNSPFDPTQIQVQRGGQCLEVNFVMLTDGHLAGHIKTPDGKPAGNVKVAIIPTVPVHPPFTVLTDAEGHYDAGDRLPGRYLVGIGLLDPYSSAEWKSRIYYPGVRTKEEARIIELGDGEWRTDIDFTVPNANRQ